MVKTPCRALRDHRRGSIYLAVLGVSIIVTALGVGGILAARVRGAADAATADSLQARQNAETGVNLLANYMAGNAGWRSRAPGVWMNAVALTRGTYSVQVTDPADGSLSNNPFDPILVRVTGAKGRARYVLEFNAKPGGNPISALGAALCANGTVKVSVGKTVNANGAGIVSNSLVRNDGLIKGSAESLLILGSGSATKGNTILAAAKGMPDSGVIAQYMAIATPITASTTIDKKLLGPGVNTVGGGTSVEGVYVMNVNGDVKIQNTRIYGTLIVNCPGKTVTLETDVLVQSARPDYPALIINGSLVIKAKTSSPLSESAQNVNFNPAGMPYLGVTNSTKTDTYPSEVQGLVHCTEEFFMKDGSLVRGGVICESKNGTAAADIDNVEIVWDPALYNSPPLGYTATSGMKVVQGSWKQIVQP